MKKYLFLLLSAAFLATACCKNSESTDYPMFWTWLEDLPGTDMEASFAHMSEAGIDGVMLHAASIEDYKRDIEIAKKYGITVYAWIWTLNPPRQERPAMLEAHPDWFSVNRNGESLTEFKAYVNSYKFLCPILPQVKEYLVDKVTEICKIEGIEGICLDYCRIVDCVLPVALSYNYGITQDTEVFPQWDFGYHPAMIEAFITEYGYDPRTLEDPSRDENWCRFRCDKVTEAANLMAETAHSYGKVVAASPFTTPKVASFMVAQDWGKWNLDIVFPMLYTDFYTMEPEFAYHATVENDRDRNPDTVLGAGLDTELGGAPEHIFKKMDAAFRGGAQAISLYTIAGLNTPELRAGFKQYADSLRNVRKLNNGKVPYTKGEKANTDPFAQETIMNVIERSMQRLAAGEDIHVKSINGMVPDDVSKVYPPLQLTDYKLIKENERIKVYNVDDMASGTRFEVIFILYGDIISGWDVRVR